MVAKNTFSEEQIKALRSLLKNRMDKNPNIEVTVFLKRHNTINTKSIITGVYNKFLTVTSNVNGYNETFSINFIDLFMGNYAIKEVPISLVNSLED